MQSKRIRRQWYMPGEPLHHKWCAFHADESGQDMIEQALLIALIALGAVMCMKNLATSIGNFWTLLMAKIAAAF